jgi:hypothetical protein
MTDEMLALARKNVAEAHVRKVVLLKGVIEAIPLSPAYDRPKCASAGDGSVSGAGHGRAPQREVKDKKGREG